MFLPLGKGTNFGYHPDPALSSFKTLDSGRRQEMIDRLATQHKFMREDEEAESSGDNDNSVDKGTVPPSLSSLSIGKGLVNAEMSTKAEDNKKPAVPDASSSESDNDNWNENSHF